MYKKNSNKNLFYLSSLKYLNNETLWKRFSQKKKAVIFFPTRNFNFNLHSFNKFNDFFTT